MTNAIDAGRAAAARRSSGVIVADDLTGAADACVAFVVRGLSGAVMLEASKTGEASGSPSPASDRRAPDSEASPSRAPDTGAPATGAPDAGASHGGPDAAIDVIAISTDSRGLPPSMAAARVDAAVRAAARPDAFHFKKIDSTLRGPVGAEIHAAMIATGASVAIVAPAFPAMGRIVDGGVLRTAGRGAIADIDIVQRLREDGLEVCVSVARPASSSAEETSPQPPAPFLGEGKLTSLSPMPAGGQGEGVEAWREALRVSRQRGGRVLVCDSVEQSDLDALVAAADEAFGSRVLWVGAAGLAHALASHVTGVRRDAAASAGPAIGLEGTLGLGRRRGDERTMSIVFVIGSTHAVTVAQQQRLVRDAMPIASADVDDSLAIEHALTMRLDVIVTMPHDAAAASVERLAHVLIARERAAPRSVALVMTGGDTAARLCRALGAARIDLGGEVAPGIPWGNLSLAALPASSGTPASSGRPAALSETRWPVVLKAGGFGDDDGLIRARRFLVEKHER